MNVGGEPTWIFLLHGGVFGHDRLPSGGILVMGEKNVTTASIKIRESSKLVWLFWLFWLFLNP